MKSSQFGVLAMTFLAGSALSSLAQEGLTLNFSPLSGSQMVFDGNSFDFSPASSAVGIGPGASVPAQWFISSESGSAQTGSALNDVGGFSGGPFTYGTISMLPGNAQTATVNFNPLSPDYLTIADGAGYLQGTIDFLDVTTVGQSGGLVNVNVAINLMNLMYSGANNDLVYLAANQPGEVVLSFQFTDHGLTLTQLSDGNIHDTSYSGSISVSAVPEPSSLAMSVLGGLGALGLGFRKRS